MITAIKNVFLHPLNQGKVLPTLLKVLWWKCNQLFFKLPVLVHLTDQYQLICEPTTSFGSFVVYARWPEYDEMNFVYKFLKKNDVYIDVGAQLGSELLVAASKISHGQLYGFEPTPTSFKRMSKNIKLNDLEDRVTVYQQAVSDQVGKARFIIEPESEVNHLSVTHKKNNTIEVETITLDRFTRKEGIAQINLLKIDTEGAEFKVLQGTQRLLRQNRIDAILFEISNRLSYFGSSPTQLLGYLSNFGFDIYQFSQHQLIKISIEQYKLTKTSNLIAIQNSSTAKARLKSF